MNNAIHIIGKSSSSRPRVEPKTLRERHVNNVNWIVDHLRKEKGTRHEAAVMINLNISGIRNYGDLRRQMLEKSPMTVYEIRRALGG